MKAVDAINKNLDVIKEAAQTAEDGNTVALIDKIQRDTRSFQSQYCLLDEFQFPEEDSAEEEAVADELISDGAQNKEPVTNADSPSKEESTGTKTGKSKVQP